MPEGEPKKGPRFPGKPGKKRRKTGGSKKLSGWEKDRRKKPKERKQREDVVDTTQLHGLTDKADDPPATKQLARVTGPKITEKRLERIGQVVRMKLQGRTNSDIAGILKCSPTTVANDIAWLRANAEQRVGAFFQEITTAIPEEHEMIQRERWQTVHTTEDEHTKLTALRDIERSRNSLLELAMKMGFVETQPQRIEVTKDATHRVVEYVFGEEDPADQAERDRLLKQRAQFEESEVIDGVFVESDDPMEDEPETEDEDHGEEIEEDGQGD